MKTLMHFHTKQTMQVGDDVYLAGCPCGECLPGQKLTLLALYPSMDKVLIGECGRRVPMPPETIGCAFVEATVN